MNIVQYKKGDIVKVVDEAGTTQAEYTYDAWGNVLTETGNFYIRTYNPFRYRGYYYDVETELYYLQSRYYDPAVGRFLNADAVDYLGATGTVLGYNLYSYCENNAVNNIDFYGTATVSVKSISKNEIKVTFKFSDDDIRLFKMGYNIKTIVKGAEIEIAAAVLAFLGYGAVGVVVTVLDIALMAVRSIVMENINYNDHGKGAKIELNIKYGTNTVYLLRWKRSKWGICYMTLVPTTIPYAYISKFPTFKWNK